MASQVLDIVIRAKNEAEGALEKNRAQLAAIGAAGAAIGVLATKSFVEFDNTMVKLRTQVGLSEGEVAKLTDTVKDISSATAVGPTELADALFTVASAGFRADEATAILKSSAEGAAVGFGTAREVAQLLTSTISSFGSENITASQAMDVLAQTIESGNFRSEELAASLGKVLPVSAAMGVSFEETGAFIANFTRSGATASEAVTALRATLLALQKPTADAEAALAAIGLESEDLIAAIAEEGLSATLIDLRHRLDEGGIGMERVIGSAEGLVAALFNTGAAADGYVAANEAMLVSNGKAAASFDILKDSAGFQFDQAWNELKVTLLEIGSIIVPMLQPLVEVFADAVAWVNQLDPGLKTAIVAFGATMTAVSLLAAAFGPLIVSATAAGTAMTVATLGIPVAIAAIVAGIALLVIHWDEVTEAIEKHETAFNIAVGIIMPLLGLLISTVDLLRGGWADLANEWIGNTERMVQGMIGPLNVLLERLNSIPGVDLSPVEVSFGRITGETDLLAGAIETAEGGISSLTSSFVGMGTTGEREVSGMVGALNEVEAAALDAATTVAEVGVESAKLSGESSAGKALREARQAHINITLAAQDAAGSIEDSEEATFQFRNATVIALEEARRKWQEHNEETGKTLDLTTEITEELSAQDKLLDNIIQKRIEERAAIPDIGPSGEEGDGSGGAGSTGSSGTSHPDSSPSNPNPTHQRTQTVNTPAGPGFSDGDYSDDGSLRVHNGIWRTQQEYNRLVREQQNREREAEEANHPGDPSPGTQSMSRAEAEALVGESWINQFNAQQAGAAVSFPWSWVNDRAIRNASTGQRIDVFHQGGVVPGPRGSESLALLQAGETVLPTQNMPMGVGGFGGVTIIVNNNGPVTGGDIADQLQTNLRELVERGF